APDDWGEASRAAFESFQKGGSTGTAPVAVDDSTGGSGTGDLSLPPPTAALAARVHFPEVWLRRLFALLAEKKQVILYGPPGTGKTFVAQHVGRHFAEQGGASRLVQFHPSYTYEDFFEGYRPTHHDGGALSFDLVHGTLREIAQQATESPGTPHLLIIDE